MLIVETACKKFKELSATQRTEVEEKIKKMRKEGEKLVKGVFEFIDAQGGWLDFSYLFFPGDPIRTVKIMHGETVEIPLVLARHLNNVVKKVRVPPKQLDPESGLPIFTGQVTKMSRCRFTPVEMM